MIAQSAVPVVIPSAEQQSISGNTIRAAKDRAAGKSSFNSWLQKVQTGAAKESEETKSSSLLTAGSEAENTLAITPFSLAARWISGEVKNGEGAQNQKAEAVQLPLQEAVAARSGINDAAAAVSVPADPEEMMSASDRSKLIQFASMPGDEAPAVSLQADGKTGSASAEKQTNPIPATLTVSQTANQSGQEKIPAEKNQEPVMDVKKALDFESGKMTGSKMSSGPQKDAQDNTGSSTQNLANPVPTLEVKFSTREAPPQEILKPPQDAANLLDQMAEKIQLIRNEETNEIKVDLKPDSLGKMSIKIAVEGGVLTAKILTDNYQVKNLLESNLHLLKQTLDSQGIKVDRTDVNVQLNNEDMFHQSGGHPQESWQERNAFVQTQRTPELLEEESTLPENDIYAKSTLEMENAGLYEANSSMSFLV